MPRNETKPPRALVVGAGGNLGIRLVKRGLARNVDVTAFVRDAAKFSQRYGSSDLPFNVVEGDAGNIDELAASVAGHDVVINTAGNATESETFVRLFASILKASEAALPAGGRFWGLAGAAALSIPYYGGTGVGLPGVPKIYRAHEINRRALEASGLDWSLMCPGPMTAAPDGKPRSDLRVSVDVVPYDVPKWAGWAPKIALSLMMKAHMPEIVVTYEDVADIIMSHLDVGGAFSRKRVGVALPRGETGRKDGWTLGKRGADG